MAETVLPVRRGDLWPALDLPDLALAGSASAPEKASSNGPCSLVMRAARHYPASVMAVRGEEDELLPSLEIKLWQLAANRRNTMSVVETRRHQMFPVLDMAQIETAKRFASGEARSFAPGAVVFDVGERSAPAGWCSRAASR